MSAGQLNRRDTSKPPRMAGYLRTSTDEQLYGIEAQRDAIGRYAAGGVALDVEYFEEHLTAKDMERPVLAGILAELAPPEPTLDGLIVAKIDRLSRSLHDLTGIFKLALDQDWSLVSLQPMVDMTSPYGKAMAQMAGVFAELERELISQRISDALAAMRARGEDMSRPLMSRELEDRICELYDSGLTQQAVADLLESEGVPTARGRGRWRQPTISDVLRRRRYRQMTPEQRAQVHAGMDGIRGGRRLQIGAADPDYGAHPELGFKGRLGPA